MTETKGAEDRISRVRSVIGRWVSICCSIFVIYALATSALQDLQLLGLFLAFSLALAFIHYPLHPQKPKSKLFIFIDLILACLSFTLAIYIYIDFWEFIFRVGIPTKWDIAFSFTAIVLVFEATRRTVGWPLLIIAIIFLLYTFLSASPSSLIGVLWELLPRTNSISIYFCILPNHLHPFE